tara:strand:+ start:1967 stop:3412 length:1446 start_codon:yes stop_codon:yes gene_type:complete
MDTRYLKVKDNTWVFRMKIPKAIQFFYGNKKEIVLSTQAHKDNLTDAYKKRDYLASKYKLQFDAIKKELRGGNIKTPEEELAFKNKIKLKEAEKVSPEALSYAQDSAVEDVLKLVKIDEKEKANPDIFDAVEKSDNSGIGKKYLNLVTQVNFLDYLDPFVKECKRNQIKQRGLDQKVSQLKAFAKYQPTFSGIDRARIMQYRNYLFDKKKIVPKTISIHLQALGQYWDFIADNFQLKQTQLGNPFRGIKLPQKQPGLRLAWRASYFEDYQDDVKILLDTPTVYLTSNLRAVIIIAMFTGARIEEICNIKKEDIKSHYQVKCIYFPKAKTDRYHRFGKRYVPIASKYNKLIDTLIANSDSDYLINDTIDKYGKRSTYLSKRFGNHKVRCGIDKKQTHTSQSDDDIEFRDYHSFRTTLNTFFSREGIDTVKRSALCGWNIDGTKSMANEVYLRLEQSYPYSKRKEDIEKINILYHWFDNSYLL